ncbi:protein lifeguard 3-like isoform X2 [Bacillus rossius redtenbacheri]|uniref:protein lifeguard 3-like isoform X2 n=1 Tax=Bacillus rossius redtenbacheri TaxID=93214 RepID=UPI002FDE23D7
MDQNPKNSSMPYAPLGWQAGDGSEKPSTPGFPQQVPGFHPQAPEPQAPAYHPQASGYYPQDPVSPPAYKPMTPGYQPYPSPQSTDMTAVLVNPLDTIVRPESDMFGPSFGDKSVRAGFVRKVYAILFIQLLVTIGIIALFIFHEGIKYQVTHSMPMYLSAYVIFLVTYFTLSCCTSIRRQHPHNIILLVVFTLAMAYMAGVISAAYNVVDVFMAMGITAAVCLGISLFAIQTKWDVTAYGIYLFVASWVILIFGIISIFVAIYAQSMIMNLVYSGLVALLFSMYLVYDTQQIVGGRKIELSPEEYIYGALQLYVDMMQIFLALLRLVGRK